MITYDFDPTKPDSLLSQALKMRGKSLREILSPEHIDEVEGFFRSQKGYLGVMVERYVFNKKPDTSPNPDFPEAGVELKTTGIKKSKGRYIAKERLVLGMIDYMKIVDESWNTSSFLKKNRSLLLMMYLYDKDIQAIDYRFKLIKLLNLLRDIPLRDLYQIQEDWATVVDKIKAGRAHELSEGDTMYLGACTKGKDGSGRKPQPNADDLAQPRAFALKARYLNFIIGEHAASITKEYGSIFDAPTEYLDVENVILSRFQSFVGVPVDEIDNILGLDLNQNAKGYYAALARTMLGIKKMRVQELEMAEIEMKIVRLKRNGVPKESMSFPAIDYMSIINEDWETSTWREMLGRKFLFVVYQQMEDNTLVFRGAKFWNMPYADVEHHAHRVWKETVIRIKKGQAGDLPKITWDSACHVRPHGRDSSDKSPTPDGRRIVKKSFWLNSKYIAKQVQSLSNTDEI